MNLHYVLPAVAAMAVHAIFVLGFPDKPETRSKPPVIEVTRYDIFKLPPEEPEKELNPDKSDDRNKPKKGSEDFQPPKNPDTPVAEVSRRDFVITPAPPIDNHLTDSSKISREPFGFLNGDPNGTDISKVRIWGEGDLDKKPMTKIQVSPAYPVMAKANGQTGEVLVEFIVDENGRVISPRVIRSTDRIFEEATLAAVSKWRFEPGRKKGRPVRFKLAVPVVFSLNQ